jgi:hypothetical protein
MPTEKRERFDMEIKTNMRKQRNGNMNKSELWIDGEYN